MRFAVLTSEIGHVLSYTEHFHYLLCPMTKIDFTPFTYVECEPSSIFVKRPMHLSFISNYLGKFNLSEF